MLIPEFSIFPQNFEVKVKIIFFFSVVLILSRNFLYCYILV